MSGQDITRKQVVAYLATISAQEFWAIIEQAGAVTEIK